MQQIRIMFLNFLISTLPVHWLFCDFVLQNNNGKNHYHVLSQCSGHMGHFPKRQCIKNYKNNSLQFLNIVCLCNFFTLLITQCIVELNENQI